MTESHSDPCGVGHPDEARPTCEECGCRIGGGRYCYEHAPYMTWPKKDGTYIVDRNGRHRIAFNDVPPQPVPPPGAVPAAPQDDGDPADAILQSVLMLIGLPSYDSAWFNENGDWDIGLLRQHGLDRRITEIRAAEASAAVPAAQDARPHEALARFVHIAINVSLHRQGYGPAPACDGADCIVCAGIVEALLGVPASPAAQDAPTLADAAQAAIDHMNGHDRRHIGVFWSCPHHDCARIRAASASHASRQEPPHGQA